jgi:hypothetical protein
MDATDAEPCQHCECEAATRSVLVTNIPFQSRGVGLVRMLRGLLEAVTSEKRESDSSDNNFDVGSAFIALERNVHGHVTNGAVSIIFRSTAEAATVAGWWGRKAASSEGAQMLIYEGTQLRCDLGAGKVRDHCFPLYPFLVRRQFELDAEAVFSVTDQITSFRMASLFRLFLSLRSAEVRSSADLAIAIDCMACAGGNTIELGKAFDRVIGIEVDSARMSSLRRNVALALGPLESRRVECIEASCVDWLAAAPTAAPGSALQRVVFLDPPWGGPNYRDEMAQRVLRKEPSSMPLLASSGTGHPMSVEDLVLQLCGISSADVAPLAAVVAVKLPAIYDTTSLAVRVSACRPLGRQNGDARERNFPFRFHFGHNVVLFVVLVAGEHSADHRLWYSNQSLSATVVAVKTWHETVGARELRPEFYDYEKKRWIVLKKWICKQPTDNLTADLQPTTT